MMSNELVGLHRSVHQLAGDSRTACRPCPSVRTVCPRSRRATPRVANVKAQWTPKWQEPLSNALCGVLLSSCMFFAGPTLAADFVETGKCLFANCPGALAACLTDKTCAENIACLQSCNGRPDESECQIRCGDVFASPAVEKFTKCAVSDKKCVKQRVEKGNPFPTPKDGGLVKDFNLKDFTGQWAITAGLNNLFDVFDCQVHQFSIEDNGMLHADIDWRIKLDDGDFIERKAVQTFKQDPNKPGYLRNDNNEYLNYTDDWYILGFKPNEYAVIYYKGNNDAWKGYGGCTVYSRSLEFPEQYRGEINQALAKMNLNIDEFKLVNNTCPPHPKLSALDTIEGEVSDLVPKPQSTNANLPDIEAN